MAEENIHAAHRRRMMKRFMENGLQGFADHEVLEMLLYFSIRQANTNPIAHALLNEFGSLHAVMEAPPEALQMVKGIGPRTAETICFCRALFRRYLYDRAEMEKKAARLDSMEQIGEYFLPRFEGEIEEVLLAAYLDNSRRVLCCKEMSRGRVNFVTVNLDAIIRTVHQYNAAMVVLAHNHPGGEITPSKDDFSVTWYIKQMMSGLNCTLVDHILVAGKNFCSIQEGLPHFAGRLRG